MLFASFFAGLIDSYNPCSLGVLFISLALLIGLKKPHLILIFGVSYLSAIFLTYFVIGLGFLRAFHLFGIHGFFGYLAGVVLILAGLMHLFPYAFPNSRIMRWFNSCHFPKNLQQHISKGVFVAGIILGVLIGLCNLPCAGGIYLGTISLLALKTTYWQGILNLFIFNLGFILPLVIIFIISTRPAALNVIKDYSGRLARYGTIVVASLMILMGIVILLIVGKVM